MAPFSEQQRLAKIDEQTICGNSFQEKLTNIKIIVFFYSPREKHEAELATDS